SILTRLMHEAPCLLRAGGWLAFEVGSGQGATMARRLRNDAAWDEVRECADGEGVVRAVLARRAAGSGEREGADWTGACWTWTTAGRPSGSAPACAKPWPRGCAGAAWWWRSPAASTARSVPRSRCARSDRPRCTC